MDVGLYMLIGWCLLCAGAIVARVKVKREAISPIFYLYLVLAPICGILLLSVGAMTLATGQYPQYGALAAFSAILFNPVALLSLFFAPMGLNRPAIGFIVSWNIFVLAGMYATGNNCPPWIMALETICGLILVAGSAWTYLQIRQLAQKNSASL